MKAVILLGTLKTTGLSNTATLVSFFTEKIGKMEVECEVIRLAAHNITPGTYLDMGPGDAWPDIFPKITAADILVFATPVWWGNHSSEIQKVIERMDEVHDQILVGKPSVLAGKPVGIIITGDSDGSQHIIGNLCNYTNALGMVVPPYATLSVQIPEQAKNKHPTEEALLAKYEKDYAKTAQTMAEQLVKFAKR